MVELGHHMSIGVTATGIMALINNNEIEPIQRKHAAPMHKQVQYLKVWLEDDAECRKIDCMKSSTAFC